MSETVNIQANGKKFFNVIIHKPEEVSLAEAIKQAKKCCKARGKNRTPQETQKHFQEECNIILQDGVELKTHGVMVTNVGGAII